MAQHETATVRVKQKPGPKPKAVVAAPASTNGTGPADPLRALSEALRHELGACRIRTAKLQKALEVLEA